MEIHEDDGQGLNVFGFRHIDLMQTIPISDSIISNQESKSLWAHCIN